MKKNVFFFQFQTQLTLVLLIFFCYPYECMKQSINFWFYHIFLLLKKKDSKWCIIIFLCMPGLCSFPLFLNYNIWIIMAPKNSSSCDKLVCCTYKIVPCANISPPPPPITINIIIATTTHNIKCLSSPESLVKKYLPLPV